MTPVMLARLLGWFSLALGALEVAAPAALARNLGLPGPAWLVRAFGVREIVAGVTVLGNPESMAGPAARAGGDVLDLAVLAPALARANPRRAAAGFAFAFVLGALAVDVFCSAALASDAARRMDTARRTRVAG